MDIFDQFLEAVNYQIDESSSEDWESTPNGRYMACINGYAALSITFNSVDRTVYEIMATTESGYSHGSFAYRWVNPEILDAYKAEHESKGLEFATYGDDIKFVDLDVVEDILEKGKALLADETFDQRVLVPLELDDDLLMTLFRMAHERDITFNQLMEEALLKAIEEAKLTSSLGDVA